MAAFISFLLVFRERDVEEQIETGDLSADCNAACSSDRFLRRYREIVLMKKPSCVRAASSDDGPEFFKVFLPSFSSYQLEIPPAFLNHLKGKLPSKAILEDQTGKSWHVDLEELDEEYFFMDGWQAFVGAHLLQYGDFLIFRHLGNYVFSVKIFGKNGCIKNFMETANPLVPHVTIKDEPDVGQKETRSTAGHFVPVAAVKDESDFDQTETNTTAPSGQKVSEFGPTRHAGQPKKGAAKFSGCSSKSEVTKYDSSKYPFYEFIVTRWSSYNVHIPKSLIEEYNITMGPNLVLEDERGKQWPVKFYFRHGRPTLSKWSDCRASNKIKAGVKCGFELVLNRRNICNKINVKIIRDHRYPAEQPRSMANN